MSLSPLDFSRLVVRRATIHDLNKAIKKTIFYNIIVFIPFMFIIVSFFKKHKFINTIFGSINNYTVFNFMYFCIYL